MFANNIVPRSFSSLINKKMFQQASAVFYDWHGTLFTLNSKHFLDAMNKSLITLGQDPLKSLSESKSVRDTLARCKGREEEAVKIFREEFSKFSISENDLIPGSKDLLKAISRRNISQAIVSNQDQYLLHSEVNRLSLAHFFCSVVGSTSDAHLKPKPDLILHAIKSINFTGDYKRILYVGDTESDVTAAKEAGCTAILISSDKRSTKADIQFDSLLHLIEQFKTQEITRW